MLILKFVATCQFTSVLCNNTKEGNLCDGDNYRRIALCPALSKCGDILVIESYEHLSSTNSFHINEFTLWVGVSR